MRRFHIPIVLITIFALGGWGYILWKVSPFEGYTIKIQVLALFVFLLGVGVTGVMGMLLYFSRRLLQPNLSARHLTRVALRQGFWLGSGVSFILFLSVFGSLNFLTGLLTVLVLVMLELYFR